MTDPLAKLQPLLTYWIDGHGRLAAVDGAWTAFAVANGAPLLTAGAVLGRPISGFIADPTTRHLYTMIYEQVRRGVSRTFPFRCDAPSLRREMRLRLSPEPEGRIRCDSYLIAERGRPAVPLLDSALPRAATTITMCSWCKRTAAGGQWLEVEEAVAEHQLFAGPTPPAITHGMCPRCYDLFTASGAFG
ncbi:MAG TPA: hypothetical protein VFU46_00705 [Gemmatimonadales bacterium]|nr:hypothetical protein [Gemmatimonadales bacterium]